MRAVSLKVLKNRLSKYVRLAASGETVLVTDRDRLVAELGPPRAERSSEIADVWLAEAVRQGWLRPPLVGPGEPPPALPIAPLRVLSSELASDRAER